MDDCSDSVPETCRGRRVKRIKEPECNNIMSSRPVTTSSCRPFSPEAMLLQLICCQKLEGRRAGAAAFKTFKNINQPENSGIAGGKRGFKDERFYLTHNNIEMLTSLRDKAM